MALVVRTAFTTFKGNLVRDILYPKPNKFKFYRDSLIFIGAMGVLAIIGFLIVVPDLIALGTTTSDFVDKSLDLITITVPPALPAAMTIGTVFAIARLKKNKINCISPPRVNVSGRVNLMVFDKTGTLTEDGLTTYGFRATKRATVEDQSVGTTENFYSAFQNNVEGYFPSDWSDPNQFKQLRSYNQTKYIECLGVCHAITRVHGELIGDPLDVRMFNSTKW